METAMLRSLPMQQSCKCIALHQQNNRFFISDILKKNNTYFLVDQKMLQYLDNNIRKNIPLKSISTIRYISLKSVQYFRIPKGVFSIVRYEDNGRPIMKREYKLTLKITITRMINNRRFVANFEIAGTDKLLRQNKKERFVRVVVIGCDCADLYFTYWRIWRGRVDRELIEN